MIEIDDWNKKQDEIYNDNFRAKKDIVSQEGVIQGLKGVTGGYYLVFKHSPEVSGVLANVSSRVHGLLPSDTSISYPQRIIHATLSDHAIVPVDDFSRDEAVLEKLERGVLGVQNKIKSPRIRLGEFLYNQTAVIAEGHPDEAFFDTTGRVLESCKKQGIELREPWGAHSTILRFTDDVSPDKLQGFLALMNETSPINMESELGYLDIGTFVFGPCGCIHEPYKRFNLN